MAKEFFMGSTYSLSSKYGDIYGLDYTEDFSAILLSFDWLWKKLNGKEIKGYPTDRGNLNDIYTMQKRNNVLLNNLNDLMLTQNELLSSIDKSLKEISKRG